LYGEKLKKCKLTVTRITDQFRYITFTSRDFDWVKCVRYNPNDSQGRHVGNCWEWTIVSYRICRLCSWSDFTQTVYIQWL